MHIMTLYVHQTSTCQWKQEAHCISSGQKVRKHGRSGSSSIVLFLFKHRQKLMLFLSCFHYCIFNNSVQCMMLHTLIKLNLSFCSSRRKHRKLTFWISTCWKEFSKRSVFCELKHYLNVRKVTLCFKKYPYVWTGPQSEENFLSGSLQHVRSCFFSAIYTLSQHLNTTAHKEKMDRRIIFTSESTSPSYLRWRTLHWARRQWQRRRFRCSPRGRGRRGYWSWGRASPSLWPAAGLRAPDAATSVMTRRTQRGTWLLKNKRKGCNKKKPTNSE